MVGPNAVYDVLVEHAGASDDQDSRAQFAHFFEENHGGEYRFIGVLGFGGKYWLRNNVVTCYPEDSTDERRAVIERTNAALAALRAREVEQ